MPTRFINDPDSPARRRARALAEADEELHSKLLKARELQGLSQRHVAEIMGVTQPTVASFEAYDNDPRLSTIRRYAHAVGVTVEHTVLLDGIELECGWTTFGEAKFSFQKDSSCSVFPPSPSSITPKFELAA